VTQGSVCNCKMIKEMRNEIYKGALRFSIWRYDQ